MADPGRRRGTYEDVLRAPPHRVAEVLDGELFLMPRPSGPHAAVASALGEELGPPFKRGRGGPGGWILLDGPEIHLGEDVVVPDLAGWRRARLPAVPREPFLTLPPDWVCEVLSPSTEGLDRVKKLRVYAREGVAHVWFVDPLARTLEVLRLEALGGEAVYAMLEAHADEARVRAEPFDAIELDLAVLWSDIAPGPG